MIRFLLAALLFALPAAAAETSYLLPAQVELLRLLPPPPAADSDEQKADLTETMARQAARTPQRAAEAEADAKESVFDMFGAVMGADFTPARIPKAVRLFERLDTTEEVLTGPAKDGFKRPRPFMAHPDVQPSLYRSNSFSYPSGHSTRSTMKGIVLGAMVPERRAAIFARITGYVESRVVGGVHYPSDLAAGRQAGAAIAAVLFNDPGFLADFGPARQEVRKALGLPE